MLTLIVQDQPHRAFTHFRRKLVRCLAHDAPPYSGVGASGKSGAVQSGANKAGLKAINQLLKRFGCPIPIEVARIKYLNNMVEQDHRTIKKRIRQMLGFKSFASASATLEGIEVANMIRKGQLTPGICPFAQFAALAT